jgi:hypothetical protein
MISIEAKRAIGIFEAATECMKHYMEVSMEIAKRDVKAFSKLFRENAELMSKLEDFVDTMNDRLSQFQIANKVDAKLGRKEMSIEKLNFPTADEERLGVRLEDPQNEEFEDEDNGEAVGIEYYTIDGNEVDNRKFPTSYYENIEIKDHSAGCEEITYNAATDSIINITLQPQKNSRSIKVKNLTDKTEDEFYMSTDFDPKFAFAPTATSRVFYSKSGAHVVRNTTANKGIFKKGDAANSQSWDLQGFNRGRSFVDRPFVAGPNFYCRFAVNGGQLELHVSDFATTNKKTIAVPEIKVKDDKDREAISTFSIFSLGKEQSLLVVLSRAGYLVVKRGENNDSLLKIDLKKPDNVFLDAFYSDVTRTIYVLRQENGQKYFIDRVTLEAGEASLTNTAKSITLEVPEIGAEIRDAKLGVIQQGDNKISIFIIFPAIGKLVIGNFAEKKDARASFDNPLDLVNPDHAYVTDIKLNAANDALMVTLCSKNAQADKVFSTIVALKAK